MSEDVSSVTEDEQSTAAPAGKSDTGGEREAFHSSDMNNCPSVAGETVQQKNDRPYGFANALIGSVAALISAILVGVLIFQTLAVYDQLTLGREALESSNESIQETIDEMRQ